MRKPPSGKILKVTVKRTQKNGDVYVYERETRYDPEKKYNKVIGSRLLYKIPSGSTVPVPTRAKRKSSQGDASHSNEGCDQAQKVFGAQQDAIEANCERTGLTSILQYVGKASGIDAAVMRSLNEADALKALSVARYLVATNGAPLPEIEEWQLRHSLPYQNGMSEVSYHNLFVALGHDETARQKLFVNLSNGIISDGIFYDSTTISTYSENINEARYGFNKDHDGLPTIKILTFYSRNERRPIAFSMQPGNIPDKISIPNALSELDFLHIRHCIVVTDTGFCTEDSLTSYIRNNVKYLTLISSTRKWIKPIVKDALSVFDNLSSLNAYDLDISQYTTSIFHEFSWQRERTRGGKTKGESESARRRVYVHVFKSASRANTASDAFKRELVRLKERIEQDMDLSATDSERKAQFFSVTKGRGGIKVSYNEEACRQALKLKGIFVLVSNSIKDADAALTLYREREWIEEFYGTMKNKADGGRTRTWSYETFKGRVTVQFIALCYYSWLYRKLTEMKSSLGQPNGDSKHDLEENIKHEKKLRSWLENKSLHQILLWFDCIETTKARRNGKIHSWTTELTIRDKLFLEKLGMKVS